MSRFCWTSPELSSDAAGTISAGWACEESLEARACIWLGGEIDGCGRLGAGVGSSRNREAIWSIISMGTTRISQVHAAIKA